jgi:hypothetical protein
VRKPPDMTTEDVQDLLDTLASPGFTGMICPVCKRKIFEHSSAEVRECEPKLQEAIDNEEGDN